MAGRRGTWLERFQERLFRPVDGASLAVFRIAFGLVLVGVLALLRARLREDREEDQ